MQVQPNAVLAAKIAGKHGITWDEMLEAVCWPARLRRAVWVTPSEHDPRPARVVVDGSTAQGRMIRVMLYPVDPEEGTWRLGTAVPLA